MKKVIIAVIIMASFMPAQAQACSVCSYVSKAWDSFVEFMEYNACRNQRLRYSQLTGRPIPPCDHKGKHDNYFK